MVRVFNENFLMKWFVWNSIHHVLERESQLKISQVLSLKEKLSFCYYINTMLTMILQLRALKLSCKSERRWVWVYQEGSRKIKPHGFSNSQRGYTRWVHSLKRNAKGKIIGIRYGGWWRYDDKWDMNICRKWWKTLTAEWKYGFVLENPCTFNNELQLDRYLWRECNAKGCDNFAQGSILLGVIKWKLRRKPLVLI